MEKAILRTLVYSDIFEFPLKKDEIWRWLIVENLKFKIVYLVRENLKFRETLEKLLKKNLCQRQREYYFLPGREKIVKIREQRERWSRKKVRIAEKVAGILRLIPWIKLIGITGSLARKNSNEEDDIDLLFITSKNRLWISRGLIVLILRILGLYRRPNKIADMICPNMLISEDSLEIKPHDQYTAHEVCSMKPIFDRDDTYIKFLSANSWAREFLPNAVTGKKSVGSKVKKEARLPNYQLLITNYLERAAMNFQLWYMRNHRTKEIVSENLIKFHPHDVRNRILSDYKTRCRQFKVAN